MTRTKLLNELRMEKFEEIYGRYENKVLSVEEASELLHCSKRTFYRKQERYKEEGVSGIFDRRLNNIPPNKIPVDRVKEILSLRGKYYVDYNIKHLQEELLLNHKLQESYSSLRRILMMHGMMKIGRNPRKQHRKRRARRPMIGMMIHQDGSTHNWLPGTRTKHDLIVTMDDATSEVYSAFLCDEEGTQSSFKGVIDVIESKGLFSTLYVDRGSHYGHTKEAGQGIDLNNPTQFSRGLKQLGIHMIYSKCPQGRGRGERMFATWQGRFPQELRKNNITTIAGANQYIQDVFLAKVNKLVMKKATEEASGFIPYVGRAVKEILSIQEERVVNNDNTIHYKNKILQLPEDKHHHHYVKSKVIVHEYEDGVLDVFYGARKLATFKEKERTKEKELRKAA
jgi:transposase